MILNLKTLADGRSVLSQSVQIEGEQAQWFHCEQPIQCRGEIDNIQTQISVHMFYECTVTLECSRCLTRFDFPIQGDFYSIIKKRSPHHHAEPSNDEESDFLYDDDTDELDIRTALFDEILLGLPMKPLCSEACAGIRPELMHVETTGEKKEIDPRWDTLKKLNSK